jgi:hypothetical protein
MNKIFRTINNNSNRLEYTTDIDNNNCHMGQKKLLFSEIEFLNYVSKYVNISDCLVLYVGASPGHHINILKKLYPDISFMLYDGLKIHMNFNDNIKIIQEYFYDSTCNDVIKYKNEINKKYLIYITDIRTREPEINNKSVWLDMINQLRWGVLLNADFMNIKLRFPWLEKNTSDHLNYKLNLSDIENKIDLINDKINEGDVLYLDGKILIQLYAFNNSTEARLFVKKNKNNKYSLKKYNCFDYEEKLLYHNTINKQQKYKFKLSKTMKKNLIGYNNSYDCVSEYFIFYKYLKYYKKNLSDYNNKIINLIYDISFKYVKYIKNKFNIYCIFYVYISYIYKLIDNIKSNKSYTIGEETNEINPFSDKEKINKILLILSNYYNKFKKYETFLNYKIKYIYDNYNILNKNSIDDMLKKIIKTNIIFNFNNKSYKLLYYNNQFNINFKAIKYINNYLINQIKNINS